MLGLWGMRSTPSLPLLLGPLWLGVTAPDKGPIYGLNRTNGIKKIKENGFELTKKRSRRYPAKTITDADYTNAIAILANTPNQAETLLHSLEQAAADISLHVNAHKTEYRGHFHTRMKLSETSRLVHLPRKQCLINRDRHRHVANEGMDSYR